MEQGEMQADDALWRPSTWSTDAVPHLQYISMLLGLVLKGRGCFLPLLEVVIKFFLIFCQMNTQKCTVCSAGTTA